MRDLPEHVTITNFEAYQVRIVRDAHEYSASFSWSRYDNQAHALEAAVDWRNMMLRELPPPGNGKGSFRRKPMAHKRSMGMVGISRYVHTDRRRIGSPQYLRFGVNWVDSMGKPRIKTFEAGKIADLDWEAELHTALTAEAFRTHWEYCTQTASEFDPGIYAGWRDGCVYPFTPSQR